METNTLRTSDLYITAYMVYKGAKVVDIDKITDQNKKIFIIEGDFDLEAAKQEYWQDEKVGVLAYLRALRHARVILHSEDF